MKQETAGKFIENQDIKPRQRELLDAQVTQQKAQTALTRREMMESSARTQGHLVSARLGMADLPARRVAGEVGGGGFGRVTEYLRRGAGAVGPIAGGIFGGALGAAVGRFRGRARPSTSSDLGIRSSGLSSRRTAGTTDYYDLWRNTYTR